jgi:cytochrome c1
VVQAGKDREIIVDEAFIRRHILDPRSVVVKGFPEVMPLTPLTDEELNTIVNYLVTIK